MRVDGALAQKRKSRSARTATKFGDEITEQLQIFKWKAPPRAKVAVTMSFFAHQRQPPSLHKLVKFYMDLLKGAAFDDDQQVHYLAANIWKQSSESLLDITVERLSTYKRRLEIYDEFRDELDDPEGSYAVPSLYPALKTTEELQRHLLSNSKIEFFDRPGRKRLLHKDFVQKYDGWHPYTILLGDLPRRGGSDEYRHHIRRQLEAFKQRTNLFKQIVIPVELDVHVTSSALERGKDLDNIMCDISPIFTDVLLSKDAYLNAYRIYVTDKIDENPSSNIKMKLLPQWEIEGNEWAIDRALDVAERQLEEAEA